MRHLKLYTLIFILILFSYSHQITAMENNPSLSDLIPDESELSDYKTEHSPEVYNDENLFDLINGEAELILEYGFDTVIVQRYQNLKTGNSVFLEIYKMKDMEGAFGLFTLYSNGRFTPHKTRYFSNSGEDYQYLQTGNYYISFTVSGPLSVSFSKDIDILKKIILSKINLDSRYPDLITQTKNLCMNPTQTVFFKGDLGLSDIIYLGIKKPFQFTQGVFYHCDGSDILAFRSGQTTNFNQVLEKTLNQFEKDKGYNIIKMSGYIILQSTTNETYKLYYKSDTLFILEKSS